MAKQKQNSQPRQATQEIPKEMPPGVKLLRTLEGHDRGVNCLAFDPQGRLLASGARDGEIRLWGAESGKLLQKLRAHGISVNGVAFDPRGEMLVSASEDGTVGVWEAKSGNLLRTIQGARRTIKCVVFNSQGEMLASGGGGDAGGDAGSVKLWEARSGKLLRTLEGHQGPVVSVAFDPEGGTLASGALDGSIKLWEAGSGKLLRTLNEHQGALFSVAFDGRSGILASGGADGTVKLWESGSGKLLRTLEGHTNAVDIVTFSNDGRLLASKSNDDTIRLWNCETWETVAVIPVQKCETVWEHTLAFHPTLPLLAAAGAKPSTPKNSPSQLIHLWALDYDVLLSRHVTTTARAVHSTTAKIVLVGDSGVGKTGLGWRLAHGEYREHDSTHGQQFWVLNQLAKTRDDGTQCEAVLWDLAGQPDYRLIHALSVQDADLALILFDPTNNRDPLGSAEYWLRQLPPECPKILVAARVDRGHPVLTNEELNQFCQRMGIAGGWLATSASSGLGLDELLERMKKAIPWDEKPAVSTDAAFKGVKDFVLALKESRTRKQIIYTSVELLNALDSPASKPPGILTEDQLLTAVRHLSNQGFVRLLTLSTGEQRILLVPELLNNLASSVVLEARRNPRGLGAVEESRLFDNSYRFRELESLSKPDQDLLLDGTITAFLANRLSYRCFRESLGEMKLLVFPDLMNLKKPERDDLVTEDGPSYILTGSTENTFAGLVVLLGYTNLFLRTDQAHDVAWFESGENDVCGVRQVQNDSVRTFVLLFSHDVSGQVRTVFEGLVEQALNRREVSVRRLRPVKCPACGTPVDRSVMARRLKQGKSSVGCEECYRPVVLPPDEPLSMKAAERNAVTHEGAVAELRTQFEEVIYEVQRLAQAEKLRVPTCFVSYAWGNAKHERWVERRLALDLEKAGIKVVLDRWDNAYPGASIPRFVDHIENADCVLVVGTKDYRKKYENKDPLTGTVVAAEMDLISARLLGVEAQKATVIPLLLEGEPKEALPPALRTRVRSDFRDDDRYFDTALNLLIALYQIDPRHAAVAHWKQKLSGVENERLRMDAEDEDGATDEAAMKRAMGQVGRRSMNSAFAAGKPVVVEQHGKLVWLHADGTTKPYDAKTDAAAGSAT